MTEWKSVFVLWAFLCFTFSEASDLLPSPDSGRACSCSGILRRSLNCSHRQRSIFNVKELCIGRTTKIDLSNNSFFKFPNSIGKYVVEVNISNNYLSEVPQVPPLNEKTILIDISENNISYATNELRSLASLKTLVASGNRLQTLSFIPDPCSLYELFARNNVIRSLEGPLRHCIKLVTLDLSDNQLDSLQAGALSELGKLEHLVLQRAGLLNITPGAFEGLQELKFLDLSGNKLTSLPSGVFLSMEKLKELFLNNNSLIRVAVNSLMGLKSLEILSLANNKLDILPLKVFSDLKDLKYLTVSHNEIQSLSEKMFSGLHNLKSVDLRSNKLGMLPSYLFIGCRSLESIILNNNLLLGITTLEYLDLGNNILKSLPPGLFKDIKSISVLNLSSNHLQNFSSKDILGLKSVSLLDLTNNQITALPTYDETWPSISYVDLEDNDIVEVSKTSLISWLAFSDVKRVLMMGRKLPPLSLVDMRWVLNEKGHTTHMGPDCACGGLQRGNAEVQFCVAVSCPGEFASWVEAVYAS